MPTVKFFFVPDDPERLFAGNWNMETNEIVVLYDGTFDMFKTLVHEFGHFLIDKLEGTLLLPLDEIIWKIWRKFVGWQCLWDKLWLPKQEFQIIYGGKIQP